MPSTNTAASDLDTLVALNDDYIRSVLASDVKRFDELLADDFLCSLSDGTLLDRKQFLEYAARPATISALARSMFAGLREKNPAVNANSVLFAISNA